MTTDSAKEVATRWLFGQPASTVILFAILCALLYGANTYLPVVLDRFDRHIMTERELFERRLDRLEQTFKDESKSQREAFSQALMVMNESIRVQHRALLNELSNEDSLKN